MSASDNAKTYTTEVLCLRSIDYGEADRILHLYAPDEGRISAIAKGARRAGSKLAGACERLNLSEVQLAKGRNLDVLCQYLPRKTFIGLRSNVLKLTYGMLFADLVAATEAANADSHEIFSLLCEGLYTLDAADETEAIGIGLAFQRNLLQAVGVHPVLNACIFSGEPLDPEALYYCFSPELGGLTSPERRRTHRAGQDGGGTEWVNVSARTISVLERPRDAAWTDSQRIKAQKFLRYYFQKVLEKDVRAYYLLFNIFEMISEEWAKETAPLRKGADDCSDVQ